MGFLPCGLSFAAFYMALAAGGVLKGASLLLAFGVGTLPGLLLLGTAATRFSRPFWKYSDLLSGMLMIGMALSLTLDVIFT